MNLSQPEYGYELADTASLLETEKIERLRDLLTDAKKDASLIGFIAGPPCPDGSPALMVINIAYHHKCRRASFFLIEQPYQKCLG
ncbi:hypothetical protein [Chamaesiphon sp. GL140_3_metabinner_50]|uniref:hypothetical protein n=1 Tax=Chamaesiphon sp. GL140_3_metabinner_50 TaxID=2970812 RepID=UPI0025EE2488|nr:hypothetical protein [Chamaesiphon sp. GL140_3_metabinner_50]